MAEQNEVILLLLGLAALLFVAFNRSALRQAPHWRLLVLSLCMLTLAWIFTILEGFFLFEFFNLLDHLSYTLSSALLALWCWRTVRAPREPSA